MRRGTGNPARRRSLREDFPVFEVSGLIRGPGGNGRVYPFRQPLHQQRRGIGWLVEGKALQRSLVKLYMTTLLFVEQSTVENEDNFFSVMCWCPVDDEQTAYFRLYSELFTDLSGGRLARSLTR